MKFMRELEENNMARAEGRKEGCREGHEAGVAMEFCHLSGISWRR